MYVYPLVGGIRTQDRLATVYGRRSRQDPRVKLFQFLETGK
jgi:hypothetical protein